MNTSQLNLNALRAFHAVAKSGGFTKAGKVLHVQQPALSRAVRLLEDELGVVLLERHKRSTTLTQVGHQIFDACARVFVEVHNIRALADAERLECSGPLRFAAASAIASHLVPKIHERFLSVHPDVWPMTVSGTAAAMVAQIASHELEFGLLLHMPRLPHELHAQVLADVRFALVIGSPWREDERVRASFIGSRELDDVTTRAYPTVDRLRRDVPDVQIRISSNDATAHKQMVLAGLGVAILPEFMVRDELATGVLTSIYPEETMAFPLNLVTRKHQVLPRAARLYLDDLAAVLAQMSERAPRRKRARTRRTR